MQLNSTYLIHKFRARFVQQLKFLILLFQVPEKSLLEVVTFGR